MIAILLGVQKLDFTTPNGDNIKGTNLFVSYEDKNVVGERAEKFFVKPEVAIPENIKIGDSINLIFNHRGKVESISKK